MKKEYVRPQKEFLYYDPGVKIGNGKFGPVNLIIVYGKLYALKIIPKETIDKPKRIEHVKNEKAILKMLRKNAIHPELLAVNQNGESAEKINNSVPHSRQKLRGAAK